jgi:acetyltransferase-like isoleucine patch superfamily enzyme
VKIYIRGSDTSVQIASGAKFFNGGASLWLEDDLSSISIGPNTSIFGDVHMAATEGAGITLGGDCLVAPGVQIRTGDSHSVLQNYLRCNHAKGVTIGDHVWLSEGAVILKGVEILSDSVVATKSVVTKSFSQKGLVIAGNPAKQVKSGISWDSRRL